MAGRILRIAIESISQSNMDAVEDMFHLNFGYIPTKSWVYNHAMEEAQDGKLFKEIEHVIYARLTDPSQLQKAASSELNEQWEIRVPKTEDNAGEGCLRVRKTHPKGKDPYYVMTTKVKANADGDKLELPIPSNEDQFKMFRFLAGKGMIKERFFFPIMGTDLVWEVDMFPKGDGTYHEWCKIDLEVESRDTELPTLPMTFAEVILPKGFGNLSDEEHDSKVSALYDQFFITKNPYLNMEQKEVSEPGQNTVPVEGTDLP